MGLVPGNPQTNSCSCIKAELDSSGSVDPALLILWGEVLSAEHWALRKPLPVSMGWVNVHQQIHLQ